MKKMKSILHLLLMLVALTGFSQCSSTRILQENAPLEIGNVYFQKWIAGIQGGGSGINLFIPTTKSSIKLDSVYFRDMAVKLESTPNDDVLYIGRFKSEFNQKKDIIMSSEPNAEFENPVPKIKRKSPFILKDNACVISYKEGDKTRYFKIENIAEKNLIAYPSAPPNKQ
jgi:hypothetical protein